MVLLDGLAGGRWALVCKTHHCMVDGAGSVDAVDLLLDAEPAPREPSAPRAARVSASVEASHGWLSYLTAPLGLVAGTGLAAARAGAHAFMHPREGLQRSRGDRSARPGRADRGTGLESKRADRGDTKDCGRSRRAPGAAEVRAALGGKVNDVVLCAATGGLRELLLARGEDPPRQGLRAMVPVNIRSVGDQGELGNKVSSLFVDLPVAEADPLRRYELVSTAAQERKAGGQALAASEPTGLTELAPPVFHAGLARMLSAKRLFKVTITNVPVSRSRLYAFGATMVDVVPIVSLAAEHALGIAVVSYGGGMTFGLCADRGTVPDLDVLIDGIVTSLHELAALRTRHRRCIRAPALRSAALDPPPKLIGASVDRRGRAPARSFCQAALPLRCGHHVRGDRPNLPERRVDLGAGAAAQMSHHDSPSWVEISCPAPPASLE